MEEINRDNVEDINNEEEIKDLLLSSKNPNFNKDKVRIPLNIKAYDFFNILCWNKFLDKSSRIDFSQIWKDKDYFRLKTEFYNAIETDYTIISLTNEQYNEHYQTIQDLISGKIDLKKKQTKNVKANKSKKIIPNNKFIFLDNWENIYFNNNKKPLSNFYINIDFLSKITNVDLHNIRRMWDSLLKKKWINTRWYFDYKKKKNKKDFINNDTNSLIENKEKNNLWLNKSTKFISLEWFFDILEQYVK